MQVELDIFSGTPNPYWELTPQEVTEFYRLFRELPNSTADMPVHSGLGYRGFIVASIDKGEGCIELRIFEEHVVASDDANLLHLFDKNRALEQWLLQTGKEHLDYDLYQIVLSEIEHD